MFSETIRSDSYLFDYFMKQLPNGQINLVASIAEPFEVL